MSSLTRDDLDPTAELPPARQWAALSVLVLAVLVISIDNTVLGFAVPALSADLAPTATELLWIVDAYAFVLAGLLVTMGNLGDRIGRRRLLLSGAAAFAVASTLAAFSTTPAMLIGARALLGVAGATLMPSTLSLIRTIFIDPDRRRVAIGIWSSCFAVGAALGPLVGGWLLEHFWWGSVFLLAVPVMALLLVAGPKLLPESRNDAPGPFDLWSNVLFMGALLPAVFAMKQAAAYGPATQHALLVVVGVGAGVAFVRRQRSQVEPLFDVSLLSHRPFATAIAANLLTNFAFVGSIFLVAQYLQLVLELDPMDAGIHLLPGMAAAFVAAIATAAFMRRLPYGATLAVGLATIAAGFVALAQVRGAGDAHWVVLAMGFIGLGAGSASSLGANLVMAIVPARRAGAASAISETSFELGAAVGIAAMGSVATTLYRRGITVDADVPAQVADLASDTLAAAVDAAEQLAPAAGSALLAAAQAAFATGVQGAATLAAVLLVGGAVAAQVSLRGARHRGDAARPPEVH